MYDCESDIQDNSRMHYDTINMCVPTVEATHLEEGAVSKRVELCGSTLMLLNPVQFHTMLPTQLHHPRPKAYYNFIR